MNKVRRATLDTLMDRANELQEDLGAVLAEEEEYRDNIPENLQGTERYEKAEEACDNIQAAIDSLDEVITSIESAKE